MRITFAAVLLLFPASASAQWTCSGGTCSTTGNVGVGTAAPFYSLTINESTANKQVFARQSNGDHGWVFGTSAADGGLHFFRRVNSVDSEKVVLDQFGNVGIGTTSPSASLDVAGTSITALRINGTTGNAGSNNTQLRFAGGTHGDLWAIGTDIAANNGSKDFHFYDFASGVRLTIESGTGNVGIGTTSPVHPLQVVGAIGAEEVIVSSTGADYVFEPGYRLQPLREVASYIQANHHLPDVPSADEVRQKGMGVGEMEAKLLAKIEELTLHMIQADERNNRLEKDNDELRSRIAKLEARVEQ